jgi:ADP-ribose pyrophosphatase YjhB (NUDIX family)
MKSLSEEKKPTHAVVVAGVVIKKDGKFLLVQEKQEKCFGKWNLPAGKVDEGDSIEKTAVKEAKEESGFDIKLVRKIDIYQEKATDAVKHVFEAEISGGGIDYPKDEILDVQWFDLAQIDLMAKNDELREKFILESIMEMDGK